MATPLEKTEALLEKAKAEVDSLRQKKAEIIEKEKQALARVEQLENTRILQLVNINKIDSDMLKNILMANQPKSVEQKPKPTTTISNERITENEEDK